MRHFPDSATLMFNQKVREHVANGREILSLGLGESEMPTPEHIVEAGVKALRDGMTKYSAPQGLLGLRERIASRLQVIFARPVSANEVVVTPGAKNALYLACAALLEDGDEVVLIRPCYVSNLPIVQLANRHILLREVDLTAADFELDHDRLAAVVNENTRLLFINTPHNPTGRMLSRADLEFIVALMNQYPHLYVLSDEVYDAMALGEPPHTALASLAGDVDRVITVNGFSKTYFMTGWRVGYVHAGKPLIKAILSIHGHINTNTAAFIQQAAMAALDGPQTCIFDYVNKLRERRAIYDGFLRASQGFKGSKFEGGYFSFLDVSTSGLDGDSFAVELLDRKNVAIVPGLSFGSRYGAYCRLSFVNHTHFFEEGLRRIQSFIEERSHG